MSAQCCHGWPPTLLCPLGEICGIIKLFTLGLAANLSFGETSQPFDVLRTGREALMLIKIRNDVRAALSPRPLIIEPLENRMLLSAAPDSTASTLLSPSAASSDFSLAAVLAANTQYRVRVLSGLKDTAGNAFAAFTMNFSSNDQVAAVDPNIRFSQVQLPSAQGQQFTALTIGPDHKLYAGTLTGQIL